TINSTLGRVSAARRGTAQSAKARKMEKRFIRCMKSPQKKENWPSQNWGVRKWLKMAGRKKFCLAAWALTWEVKGVRANCLQNTCNCYLLFYFDRVRRTEWWLDTPGFIKARSCA